MEPALRFFDFCIECCSIISVNENRNEYVFVSAGEKSDTSYSHKMGKMGRSAGFIDGCWVRSFLGASVQDNRFCSSWRAVWFVRVDLCHCHFAADDYVHERFDAFTELGRILQWKICVMLWYVNIDVNVNVDVDVDVDIILYIG
jgi:hypothetical protein